MTAETISRQMQNHISSLEHAATPKNVINESRDCSKRILNVHKCHICEASFIAAMTKVR